MSAGHTPGPWFVTNKKGGSAGCTVWARAGEVIVAECRSTSISLPGRQLDAALIASAPDMLDALHQCRAVLRTVLSETPETDEPKRSVLQRRIETADAAITSATGATS